MQIDKWTKLTEGAQHLDFPLDQPRAGFDAFVRETCIAPLTSAVQQSMYTDVVSDRAASLFVSAAGAVLSRHCDQQDVVLGVLSCPPELSRPQVVPVRITHDALAATQPLADYTAGQLDKSRRHLLALCAGSDTTAATDTPLEMQADCAASFNCVLAVCHRGSHTGDDDSSAFLLSTAAADSARNVFVDADASFRLELGADKSNIVIEFNPDVLDADRMAPIAGQILAAMEALVENPHTEINKLPLVSAELAEQVVQLWNATDRPYPDNVTLASLFEGQVRKTPDAIAVRDHHCALTYRQFYQQVAGLARELETLGVGPERIVVVQMARSIDMLQAIYATLLAGGAYLPIDPAFPAERRHFMTEDAKACLVIADHLETGLSSDRQVLEFRQLQTWSSDVSAYTPAQAPLPDHLAYVIYTSGSTGQPKGVMIEHRAICNRLLWMQEAFVLSAEDSVIQKTPTTFDVSVWELFWPLQTGASLFMAEPEAHKDPTYLKNTLLEQSISVAHFVPSMLDIFLAEPGIEACKDLRLLFCSGEALRPESVELCLHCLSTQLHNLYGPTEAAVDVTHWACERDADNLVVPIGYPVANTQIYILDAALEPVPVGAVGELYIGGTQVARGYLNRPELNAERFMANPFRHDERLYRTGDRARWRTDGSVEYLGRIDGQVKLRGQRIELGEIEAALSANEGVRHVVVLVVEKEQGDQRLAAFVVAEKNTALDTAQLREALSRSLPAHMVPAVIRVLDAFPLGSSGKLDRGALAALFEQPDATGDQGTKSSCALPVNSSDAIGTITAIWRDALDLPQVGLDDNFFDLGGHSFLVLKVRAAIAEQLGLEVTMTDLFRYPTINTLSGHLGLDTNVVGKPVDKTRAAQNRKRTLADGVAIIGMDIRVPGSNNLDAFWQNLVDGNEGITFFSEQELLDAGVPAATVSDPDYVRARGILRDIECFDAEFFDYSRRDAEIIDPQQRLFLEGAWHTFEHAGYDPTTLESQVGVYAGTGMNRYAEHNLAGHQKYQGPIGEFQRMIGNDKDFLSSRVAYKLNLHGPALTVQTACSTSLVAIHLACESLCSGNCDMALAGGVSIDIPELAGYEYQEGMIVSADGHCRPFDAKAGGTVFASGMAVVLLKPLQAAIEDNDTIHAVIKGSAINNDGAGKVGYTAPGVEGQIQVITTAQQVAGIDAESIGYIEAHGTGTALGDPIEVLALSQAFGQSTDKTGYCALGALKSNIGHTDAAAGAAGLIKTTLSLSHRQLPPTLHYKKANPDIDFDNSPFYVNCQLQDWVPPTHLQHTPLRAGVSSFGIGGTNAHVILEEYLESPTAQSGEQTGSPAPQRASALLCLSARTKSALCELAGRYAKSLSQPDAPGELADLCFTANTGRTRFEQRLSVVADDAQVLATGLSGFADNANAPGVHYRAQGNSGNPQTAFLYTGQGSQWPGMGKDLFDSQPVFRQAMLQCAAILEDELPKPLLPVIWGQSSPGASLDDTRFTQPALFALEWSLTELWRSWGVAPSIVLGHSVGEYVAACVAGVFSLEDGLRMIAARGRLMQALPSGGSMVSVAAPEQTVSEAVAGHEHAVSLAAKNGPASIVVSGQHEQVEQCLQPLRDAGVSLTALTVSHAFHSPLMEPMLDEFESIAATVDFSMPSLPVVSNVTGRVESDALCHAGYWRKHVRATVDFATGMRTLHDQQINTCLEIGPAPILSGLGQDVLDDDGIQWISSLRRNQAGWPEVQKALGEFWQLGQVIDWRGYEAGFARKRIAAPTYPFQRERYWVEPVAPAAQMMPGGAHTGEQRGGAVALSGTRLNLPGSSDIRFETRFTSNWPPYVPDHRIFGTLVVAGASHVSLFLQTACRAVKRNDVELSELFFLKPFVLGEDDARDVQVVFDHQHDDEYVFSLLSTPAEPDAADNAEWTRHAEGRLAMTRRGAAGRMPETIEQIQGRCASVVSGEAFYRDEWVQGDDAGESFRWIDQLWRGQGEALASIRPPAIDDPLDGYALHPGLIEACFQVMRGGYVFESQAMLADGGDIYVPFRIERCRYFGLEQRAHQDASALWCYGKVEPGANAERVVANLSLFDSSGNRLAEIEGFEVRRLPRESLRRSLNLDGSDWLFATHYEPCPLVASPEAGAATAAQGQWIVFTDRGGVGSGMAIELAQQGYGVTLVNHLLDDEQGDANSIDPGSAEAYQQIIRRSIEQGQPIAGVAHLWSLDQVDPDACRRGLLPEAHQSRLSADSLLLLMQAFTEQLDGVSGCRLAVVTRAGQSILPGAEPVDPWSCSLWGLARVFALENPDFTCQTIDLDAAAFNGERQSLADELATEPKESHVCLRESGRHVGRLKQAELADTRPRPGDQAEGPEGALARQLSSEGAYLVTGGMRGLGLEVGKWLCMQGVGEVILVGRNEPSAEVQSELSALASATTEVTYRVADVANPDRVDAILADRPSGAPALHGVIHAAGVIDDGLISGQTLERLHAVMQAKVQGTLNLASLADQAKADVFLVFSSATSVLGAGGQATYAVANAFVDGVAQARQQAGLPAVAVNWGPWAEVGMASRLSERDQRKLSDAGFDTIGIEHGMDIMGRLLSHANGQLAVLPIHWERYCRVPGHEVLDSFLSGCFQREPMESAAGASPAARRNGNRRDDGSFVEQLASLSNAERLDQLISFVAIQLADLLGSSDPNSLDTEQGFVDLGLDSLMGVELRRRLQSETGLKLATTFAFDFPTILSAAGHLDQKMAAATTNVARSSPLSGDGHARNEQNAAAKQEPDSIEQELARLESRLGRATREPS